MCIISLRKPVRKALRILLAPYWPLLPYRYVGPRKVVGCRPTSENLFYLHVGQWWSKRPDTATPMSLGAAPRSTPGDSAPGEGALPPR